MTPRRNALERDHLALAITVASAARNAERAHVKNCGPCSAAHGPAQLCDDGFRLAQEVQRSARRLDQVAGPLGSGEQDTVF